jgi:signal transduction histidine kinase/ActR/RegA family two-component response regulator
MRKLLGWMALLFIFINAALWLGVVINNSNRQQEILTNWNAAQMVLVKNIASGIQGWAELRLQNGGNLSQVEQEVVSRFISPIHLLQNGNAWIYSHDHVIYDQSPDFPAAYQGKSIDQVFELQKTNGASNYAEVVQGVLNATDGTSWYIWLPEKGREFTAWTSIHLTGATWTIGISTPEPEILASSGLVETLNREMFGVGAITLLLWGIYFLIMRQQNSAATQMKMLEKSVNDQTALAQRVTSQSEELAQINAELGRASSAKDEFLANMGHELRTPLSTIIGLSYALKCQVYGPVTEKQAQSLETILTTGQHLSSLINDILDLSKIQAGKMKLDVRPIQLSTLLESSLMFVDQQAFQKNIKVSTKRDEQVSLIEGDELRLKQLLINLLNNAVKFTPEGGELGVEVLGDPEEQRVAITVWDTGIGIPAEELPRLFKPFVQLDGGTNRQYSGTGLGLSLVVRIAEMHDGSIAVTSEVSKGSRFTLYLPWRGNDYQGQSEDSMFIIRTLQDVARPEGRVTILIVNSQAAECSLLCDFFSAVGYEVAACESVEDAFRICKERQVGLIVVNIQMPDAEGQGLIRLLHSTAVSSALPMVALTSLTFPGAGDLILGAGADQFIQKPIRLDRMAELVRTLLLVNKGEAP